MDELAKIEMRNYSMAGGFLLIAVLSLIPLFGVLNGIAPTEYSPYLFMLSLGLILCGLLLIICKNRDLTGITFLMFGMIFCIIFQSQIQTVVFPNYLGLLTGIILLVLALVILTAKDKKKYLLAILPALMGLRVIITGFAGPSSVLPMILIAAIAVIALYFALASASERFNLPTAATLKADVVTDFKASGSVLGYLVFAMVSATWALFRFSGPDFISISNLVAMDVLCGLMMIFVGILLFAVGKMRFTPIMFIVLGILVYLGGVVDDSLLFVIGIAVIVLGLFAVLRKESRILPAIMLFVYGIVFILASFAGESVSSVLGVLNLIPCLIAIYLAFAVFSQSKKLKMF